MSQAAQAKREAQVPRTGQDMRDRPAQESLEGGAAVGGLDVGPAVVDQLARETAAATELQRGMAECTAEHAKLATVLREKYPDQDWSTLAPAPLPAKR